MAIVAAACSPDNAPTNIAPKVTATGVTDVTRAEATLCGRVELQGTTAKPIRNVYFENVNVDKAGIGLSFSNTESISIKNCNLGGYVGVPSTASQKDKLFDKDK